MQKKLIVLFAAIAVGGALMPDFHEASVKEIVKATLQSIQPAATTAERAAMLPGPTVEKTLNHSFQAISLDDPGEGTAQGISTLAAGLNSADNEVRIETAPYVESLVIKVVHGNVSVHPANQEAYDSLVRLYKKRAPEQIQKLQKAFPESRTLAYLQKN